MTTALLGSGEFLPWAADTDRQCIASSPSGSDRVLILPTASAPEGDAIFTRWGEMGLSHYRSLGASPAVLPVRTRDDADDPAIAEQVAGAALIFFSGGDPGYLAETLRATALWRAILTALDAGTAYGGCSAGASAVGVRTFSIENERLGQWMDGLALLPRAYLLPHFDQLDNYIPGLRRQMLAARPPGSVIVGIDENTALVGGDSRWRVAGEGAVWIGSDAGDLVAYRDGDEPVATLGIL